MHTLVVIVIFSILAIAILNRILSYQRKNAGLTGWVSGQDLDGSGKKFYDKRTGIIVKPDLLQTNSTLIEYKSREIGNRPIYSDVMQVALQMMVTGFARAELRYKNRSFFYSAQDPFVIKAANDALETVNKIREHLHTGQVPLAAPHERKCAACSFRGMCPEAIG